MFNSNDLDSFTSKSNENLASINDNKSVKKRKKSSIESIEEQIKKLEEKKLKRLSKLYEKTGKIVIEVLQNSNIELSDIETSDLFFDELKIQIEHNIENFRDTIE